MMMHTHEMLYEWLVKYVKGDKYRYVLNSLYETEFRAIMPLDDNRIQDGVNVRSLFGIDCGISEEQISDEFDESVCSILEMMVGLSVRIEETIMSDVDFGDRTSMWFWMMIKSMGLYNSQDSDLDHEYVEMVIEIFLDRTYMENGKGGLFSISDNYRDMRKLEIWDQMCLFLDTIL